MQEEDTEFAVDRDLETLSQASTGICSDNESVASSSDSDFEFEADVPMGPRTLKYSTDHVSRHAAEKLASRWHTALCSFKRIAGRCVKASEALHCSFGFRL